MVEDEGEGEEEEDVCGWWRGRERRRRRKRGQTREGEVSDGREQGSAGMDRVWRG